MRYYTLDHKIPNLPGQDEAFKRFSPVETGFFPVTDLFAEDASATGFANLSVGHAGGGTVSAEGIFSNHEGVQRRSDNRQLL